MKGLALRFWRWLFPLPEVGGLEAFLARVMMAYGLWYFFPVFMQHTGQPVPVGLAHWFDLTWMHDTETFALYRKIFAAALVIYAAGVALPVTVTVITIMHILPWTLHNSQGFTYHGNQIMSLTLMAQTATVWWLTGRKTAGWLQPSSKTNQWLLFNSQFAIATAYFVSVCSKMIRSDWQWFQNSPYVALDFVKTMRQNYYSSLDPQYAVDPPFVAFFMEHALLAASMFSFGVVLEIVLFFVIGQRLWGLVIGVLLILMHLGIAEMMNLFFPTHLFMLVVFFINVPFLIALGVGKIWGKAQG